MFVYDFYKCVIVCIMSILAYFYVNTYKYLNF